MIFQDLGNLNFSRSAGINLSISNLFDSIFRLTKFDFNAQLEASIPAPFFKSAFVA